MYENKEKYFGVPVPLNFSFFPWNSDIFQDKSFIPSIVLCTKFEFGKRAGYRTFLGSFLLGCLLPKIRYCPCLGTLIMTTKKASANASKFLLVQNSKSWTVGIMTLGTLTIRKNEIRNNAPVLFWDGSESLDRYTGLRFRIRILLFSSLAFKMPAKNKFFLCFN